MSDLPALSVDEFGGFFEAVHGHSPFPWQARLAREVAEGAWPEVLNLPTGTGKTAVLDVAVFHLALSAGAQERLAPLRMVYVVDRRTIVDQAYERAARIVAKLREATDGVLARVKARLESLGRDKVALRATMLRGAIARSDMWARSPDQPLIAVSTVDQVGSRLLFRGYGVSDGMKPIHAGLLGNDVLYMLDEVHLSAPFRETLGAIGRRYAGWTESGMPRRFGVVEMSATHAAAAHTAFELAADDEAHPVLARRLSAPKPARLAEARGAEFAKEIEKAAKEAASEVGTRVAVVVNRVATAREIFRSLTASLRAADVQLVTGRMRPADRAAVEAHVVSLVRASEGRTRPERSVVVVATQCIEAGADFDFDVLVTECASLDALRQRFGRLDRLGAHGSARGVIVARRDSLAGDPVYGDALGHTFRWLSESAGEGGQVGFGLREMVVPPDARERGLLAPSSHAPVLLPAHLDAWVQTAPMPVPDPEVALWLHGPERGVADVQVVWRADVEPDALARALNGGAAALEDALACVEAMPPASPEAMSVPFGAVRRWLMGRTEAAVADVEGAQTEAEDRSERPPEHPRPACAWRGERSTVVLPDGLRPGDTVVVPASYGGIDAGTWAPASEGVVADVGELAVLQQRGRAVLRLHPEVLAALGGGALPAPPEPSGTDGEDVTEMEVVLGWLARARGVGGLGPALVELLDSLHAACLRPRGAEVARLARSGGEYFVVSSRWPTMRRSDEVSGEATTEGDTGSFTGVEVRLGEHMRGVASLAADFARRVGLPEQVIADVRLAGAWHDAGKADPRFQRMLHGGSEYRAANASEPLAKSAVPMRDPAVRRRAWERSGYPKGTRHEVMSVALMDHADARLREQAHDWDLVRHLVASHHGYCRPLAPWAPDSDPQAVRVAVDGLTVEVSSAHGLERLDSGVGERFWTLVRRYGWWGLAWIETVLRLGDHRRSEEEAAQAEQRRGNA